MTDLPTEAAITYVAGEPAGPWVAAVLQLYQFIAEATGSQTGTSLVISGGSITPTRGALGAAGNNAVTSTGGAAGKYILGNSFVTWSVPGTLLGGVA